MKRQDAILLLIAAVLVVLPLVLVKAPGGPGTTFLGADSQAQAAAGKLAPGYKPWFKPVWEPPSTEISSLIFALQAGVGCGFLGYYAGLRVGRRRADQDRSPAVEESEDA